MSTWTKDDFNFSGGYLTYKGRFVARFKYRGAPIKMGMFKRALTKYFTPEEYFAKLENDRKAPLEIMEDCGLLVHSPIGMFFNGKRVA